MPTRRSNTEWTDGEKAYLRFAASLSVIGLVGVILPIFGLKFQKVQDGELQVPISIGLIFLGVVVAGIVVVRHGTQTAKPRRRALRPQSAAGPRPRTARLEEDDDVEELGDDESTEWLSPAMLRRVFYIGGGVFLSFIVLCAGWVFLRRPRLPQPQWQAQQPVAPQFPPQRGPVPNAGPRMVRVRLKNIKNLDLAPVYTWIAAASQQSTPVMGPPSLPFDELTASAMVNGSFEEFVGKLEFGKVESSDPKTREVVVIVDRSKFVERQ